MYWWLCVVGTGIHQKRGDQPAHNFPQASPLWSAIPIRLPWRWTKTSSFLVSLNSLARFSSLPPFYACLSNVSQTGCLCTMHRLQTRSVRGRLGSEARSCWWGQGQGRRGGGGTVVLPLGSPGREEARVAWLPAGAGSLCVSPFSCLLAFFLPIVLISLIFSVVQSLKLSFMYMFSRLPVLFPGKAMLFIKPQMHGGRRELPEPRGHLWIEVSVGELDRPLLEFWQLFLFNWCFFFRLTAAKVMSWGNEN